MRQKGIEGGGRRVEDGREARKRSVRADGSIRQTRLQPIEGIESNIHQMTCGPKLNNMGVYCPVAIYFSLSLIFENKSARKILKTMVRSNKCDSGHTRTRLARDKSSSVYGEEGCGREKCRGSMDWDSLPLLPPKR